MKHVGAASEQWNPRKARTQSHLAQQKPEARNDHWNVLICRDCLIANTQVATESQYMKTPCPNQRPRKW